jgi:hypothetical protein
MKPNKRSTLLGKRTRVIKKSRGRKGTRRSGKKSGGFMNKTPSPLVTAATELVNDTATRNLFQDAISKSDLNAAMFAFIKGSRNLQQLIATVIKIAEPVSTTSSDMKQADEIIRTGISGELINAAINSKNVGALSTIGAHEVALKIMNLKIDEYEKNKLTDEEHVLIDKFVEQLETTLKKIEELYEAVKFETHKSYVSRGLSEYIPKTSLSFTGKK